MYCDLVDITKDFFHVLATLHPSCVNPKRLWALSLFLRLVKLLRGTYGDEAVTRTTKGDQISVRLDGQTAVVDLNTLVRKTLEWRQNRVLVSADAVKTAPTKISSFSFF